MKPPVLRAILISAITTVLGTFAHAQVLVHDYKFLGNLNDSVGSDTLTSLGGTVGAGSYTFGVDQGLVFSGETALSGSYSIALRYSLSSISGFDKVVDYKSLGSDNGFYNRDGSLEFYPVQIGSAAYLANQSIDVVVTRDGTTGLFDAYLNGVLQVSFVDSTGLALANVVGGNSIFNFFTDDFATSQREASAGVVTELRIFDGALSSSSIATAFPPNPVIPPTPGAVPEPGTYGLIGSTVLGALIFLRRTIRR